MENIKVELFVIVDAKNSFCSSETSFNNLLKSIEDISINNNKLKHKELEVDYQVQSEELEGKSERYFHLKLTCNDIERISEFENLIRDVRDMLHKMGNGYPQTLWDDIGFYYAINAYPLIYEIENLMRKLITKFMVANVGLGWTKDNIPDEVRNSVRVATNNQITNGNSIKNKSEDSSPDYLYKTDFIQLANFLFKDYSPHTMSTLFDKIGQTSEITELSLNDLKNFVPKSNWKRYFCGIVDCDDSYLSHRWNKLYTLRCKIAHNTSVNKSEYNQIKTLVSEVREKLEKAINNLDKIHISKEDKEIVAENIASNSNEFYSNFIDLFKKFENILYKKASNLLEEKKSINGEPLAVSRLLKENKLISEDLFEEVNWIIKNRNLLVYDHKVEFSKDEIENLNESVLLVMKRLKNMQEPLQNDWSKLLRDELEAPYMEELLSQLEVKYGKTNVFPNISDIFNALHYTSYEQTKVVILGQDPYHGQQQAHGLSFSVERGTRVPPSLRNIYKELEDDIGCPIPDHGNLEVWAKQGVLLLNSVLTVEEGSPNSHREIGWERFTDSIIDALNQRVQPVVFVLWGSHAQSKAANINKEKHHIIVSTHPSPLSAHRGFLGSKPFSRTNTFLKSIGSTEIDWCIPALV